MYILSHAISQRGIYELMLTHLGFSPEKRTYDHGLEVAAVTRDVHVIALQALFNPLLDEIRIHESSRLVTELVAGADERQSQQ